MNLPRRSFLMSIFAAPAAFCMGMKGLSRFSSQLSVSVNPMDGNPPRLVATHTMEFWAKSQKEADSLFAHRIITDCGRFNWRFQDYQHPDCVTVRPTDSDPGKVEVK